ncbi:MAG: hypothetical protein QF704_17965, partial [Anaerolineales bacterium]|nr:hypothetical protein [Anaerolineales bacterium]
KIVIGSRVVTTFAGTGNPGSVNGAGISASFYGPKGIETDGTNLYVTDTSNHLIRKIVISTGVVTTIAGTTGSSGSNNNATGTSARFYSPYGMTVIGPNLYVADLSNHMIRKIALRETRTVDLALHNLDDDTNVTVDVTSLNTSEANVNPSSLTFTPNNWATPKTVTVTGVDDSNSDGNSRYGINLSTEVE